jgi:hypothetical protein
VALRFVRAARLLAIAVAAAAVVAGAAIRFLATPRGDTRTAGALPRFAAAALREDFNAARHAVRVVAILSPT